MSLIDFFDDWFGDWDTGKWMWFGLLTFIIWAGYFFIAIRTDGFNLFKPAYVAIAAFGSPAAVIFFINNPETMKKK